MKIAKLQDSKPNPRRLPRSWFLLAPLMADTNSTTRDIFCSGFLSQNRCVPQMVELEFASKDIQYLSLFQADRSIRLLAFTVRSSSRRYFRCHRPTERLVDQQEHAHHNYGTWNEVSHAYTTNCFHPSEN